MRIATWNLERPRLRSWSKLPGVRDRIASIAADVWILTETNVQAITLETTHPHLLSTPSANYHTDGECWAAIQSRWPLERLATSTPDVAIAARIQTPTGPIVMYG